MTNSRIISIARLLSPFTNLGSRQFPLSRIRGAAIKQRFKQTYEVFRGHAKQNPHHDSPKSAHFGMSEYVLVLPTALHALSGILTKFDSAVSKTPYIVIHQLGTGILAIPRLAVASTTMLLDYLVVVPASLIMTALCTPGIVLAHLAFATSSKHIAQLTEKLTSGVNVPELRGGTYRLIKIQTLRQEKKDDDEEQSFELQLQDQADDTPYPTRENTIKITVETADQKKALSALLSCNAFGSAQFFDNPSHASIESCAEFLDDRNQALEPRAV